MEMTAREAAGLLSVNQSRVRALIASGALDARRVGTQWLIDADSVDRQAALIRARATGRSMAVRVAWAAGDLADGGDAEWLLAGEKYRLRKRLSTANGVETLQKWLRSRSIRSRRFHVGGNDLAELLREDGVVATGVSASTAWGLGLSTGGAADAYANARTTERLIRDYVLIESHTGNLTLREVDHDLHLRSARDHGGLLTASRLVTGVDLADDRDTRTNATGRTLLNQILSEQQQRSQ